MSLALHVALLTAFFGAASGALVSGGEGADDGDRNAVNVSLGSLAGGRTASTDPAAQQLADLYRKVLASQGPITATDKPPSPRASVQSLFDALDRSAGAGGEKGDGQGTGSATEGDVPFKSPDASKRGGEGKPTKGLGPGTTASTGALWGAVEPCWRRMPNVSRVPVTLEVKLNDAGLVADPPRIVRTGAAGPDEQRLISEARALAAIAACVPYQSSDFLAGKRTFVVQFATAPVKPR